MYPVELTIQGYQFFIVYLELCILCVVQLLRNLILLPQYSVSTEIVTGFEALMHRATC